MEQHHTDRAASYIKSEDYEAALLHSRKAIKLDKLNERAHEQIITASLYMGDLYELEEGINKLQSINPTNEILGKVKKKCTALKVLTNEAKISFKEKQIKDAIEKINKVLGIATASEHFSSLKVEYMIAEKKQNEVS